MAIQHLIFLRFIIIQKLIHGVQLLSYENNCNGWSGICKTGKKQSPIDIMTKDTIGATFSPFEFRNYDQELNLEVTNKKHSIKFQIPSFNAKITPPHFHGAGFEDNYQFLQGHFHWGSDNDHGSEHGVDGGFAPMEVHLVHWNTKYGTNANEAIATNEYKALAVLGSRFSVGRNNKELAPLFKALANITEPGEKIDLRQSIKLLSFASDTRYFFRYNGSLTTPGCNEIVVWTLFKDPIEISQEQLNMIRKTKYDNMKTNTNNYRPVQDINGRKIYDSSSPDKTRIDFLFLTGTFLIANLLS